MFISTEKSRAAEHDRSRYEQPGETVAGSLASAAESRPTQRSQAKADRRAALLEAAAALFAERGFNGVSIEDLGSAAGVSGPAVYRHFSTKQAVLGALLVGVSEHLLDGGTEVDGRRRTRRRHSAP